MPNGLADVPNSAWNKANTSRPTADFFARDQPLYIINAAEIWLLRSEAALFGLWPGNANEVFQTGIKRAMSMWNASSDDIQNYLDSEPQGTLNGTQEEQFEQISSQMWVAFIPNFVESWHNIRRTGYPIIPQRFGADMALGVTNGILPKKVRYPFTVEKTVNGDNLQEAIDRMGGEDKIDVPVWWDAR